MIKVKPYLKKMIFNALLILIKVIKTRKFSINIKIKIKSQGINFYLKFQAKQNPCSHKTNRFHFIIITKSKQKQKIKILIKEYKII